MTVGPEHWDIYESGTGRRPPHCGHRARARSSPPMRLPLFAILLAACTRASSAPTPSTSYPASYETIITGGRIVDGTGNAWVYGDIGLSGDRIARIAPPGMLAR